MARDIPIGNGALLLAFDRDYQLREFYYPRVGQENHAKAEPFRFGVWVDGRFSWVPQGWSVRADYLDDSLVTEVELVNAGEKLRIVVNDAVDYQDALYVKKLTVENLSGEEREIRLFFCHDFHIMGNSIGDTAAYRPEARSLLHYKAERYFLINLYANKKYGVDFFATGNKEEHGKYEGTWKDAEDGTLSGNPIAQGSVDSVVAMHLRLGPREKETCYYWICVGRNWAEVSALNDDVVKRHPETYVRRTLDYWNIWSDKEQLNYGLLPRDIARLYRRSLLIARTQIDNGGSIIAANDSDAVYFNRDTYSYMWPRDAALAAYALDLAGYPEVSVRFFNLCATIIEKGGYFFHKYTPSGAMASSWHPWQKDGLSQLPIQEDETALVIWALWKHFLRYRDIEFIRPLYKSLIQKAAGFMMSYRDIKTKLPLSSYDLWEERQGVFTFTAATVYGGLVAAAGFAGLFGETELNQECLLGAQQLRQAMDKYLYLEKEKRFARSVIFEKNGSPRIDATVDASLFGTFAFGAYAPDDEKVRSTMQQVYDVLWCKTDVGGLARYENDTYYSGTARAGVTGNPWFVTTLWLAHYYSAAAKTKSELEKALAIMSWACRVALPSGVLAEQVDPYTGAPLSVSPLTWSHMTFVAVVQEYLDKLLAIERCTACDQPRFSKKRPSLETFPEFEHLKSAEKKKESP